MSHISIENIIDFVSLEEMNEEGLELTKTVNMHLTECAECRCKVRAAQTVYDEMLREGRENARLYLLKKENRKMGMEYPKEL